MLQTLLIDKYREAVIRIQAELAARRSELAAELHGNQRDELKRCIHTIETILPVYRQMEIFLAFALGILEAID